MTSVLNQVTWVPNQARNDEAADAAQFLSRFGYVLLALGVPAGVVLHELAIFVLYPVAVASFVLAALIDPPGGMLERMRRRLLAADRRAEPRRCSPGPASRCCGRRSRFPPASTC